MSACRTGRWATRRSAISISAPGRIVYQDLTRINKAIADGELARNEVLQHSLCAGARPAAAFSRPGFRWRSAQPLRASRRAGQRGAGRGRGRHHGPRLHRWPRHFADGRGGFSRGLRSGTRGQRRAHRHGRRPLFCDGSRPALGSHQARLGRHRARPRETLRRLARASRPQRICERRDRRIHARRSFSRIPTNSACAMAMSFFSSTSAPTARASFRSLFSSKDFDGFDREVHPAVHYVTLTQYDVTYPSPLRLRAADARTTFWAKSSARRAKNNCASPRRKNIRTSLISSMAAWSKPFPGEDAQIIPSPKVATYDLQAGDERARSHRRRAREARPTTTSSS